MIPIAIAFLMLATLGVRAADTPAAAIDAVLKALRDGKSHLADLPEVAVSPFCPEAKKETFEKGLEELAGLLDSATTTVEESVPARGSFTGYRLILRQKQNPLQVAVRPICVLRTDKGWKVAAGLANFDNTNFGFDPELSQAATSVSEATRKDAKEAGQRLLAQGAQSLWQDIRARRAAWPADEPAEAVIARYFDFDLKKDAIGKLACCHIPNDLAPANMERFLAELAAEGLMEKKEAAEKDPATTGDAPVANPTKDHPPLTIAIDGKQEGDHLCRVYGVLDPENPSDYQPMPIYLRKGDGNRWLVLHVETEIEELRKPKSELTSWYDDNEETFAKQVVLKLAAQGRETAPIPAARGDGAAVVARYLDALARRAIPEVLGMLDLPDDALVDDYDGLLEEIGKQCWRLAPQGGPAATITQLRWHEAEKFGGAANAIFQPAAAFPFLMEICLVRWTPAGWRVLPPSWDGAPASPKHEQDAIAIEKELKKDWDALKREAALRLFAKGTPVAEAGRDGAIAVRELADKAFAAAVAGDFAGFFAHWQTPGKDTDPTTAVKSISKFAWETRKAGKVPAIEAIKVQGAYAGVLLPMDQAKREDGQKPGRMLVACRTDGAWQLVAGLEIFRPINRGFKELNAKVLRDFHGGFDELGKEDLEALRAWVEAPAAAAPPP